VERPSADRKLKIGDLPYFAALLSPLSWIITATAFAGGWIIINGFSLLQTLVVFAIDQVSGLFHQALYVALARRRFSTAPLFFKKLDLEEIAKLSSSQKNQLVGDLRNFPVWSADTLFKINFLKGVPAVLTTLHVVNPPNPVLWGAYLYLLIFTMAVSMRALQVVEGHSLASRLLRHIHIEVNLGPALQQLEQPVPRDEFRRVESWSFVMISLSLAVQVVLLAVASPNDAKLPLQVGVAVVVSMLFLGRLFWSSRQHFLKGFEPVFSIMREYNPLEKVPNPLPLHTTSVHARTEEIVNSLFSKIRSYEEELVHQVFEKAEEQRYRSLGEISALVVHDLASPLQAIQYIAEKADSDPQVLAKNPRYQSQLTNNVARMYDLLQSLRSYLKNQQQGGTFITYQEAHQHALKLLATRFVGAGLDKFVFEFDDRLSEPRPALSQPDLIHVLMNIYGNATENMLKHRVASPRLSVRLREPSKESFIVEVSDNGSGLDPEQFETLTGDDVRGRQRSLREGLGLRLVRRLLKSAGGDILIDAERSGVGRGTTLLLVFPRHAPERSNELAS
jgi:signal transduction histidine kinase